MSELKFRAWGRPHTSDTPVMTNPFDFRLYVMYNEGAQERLLPTVGEDVVYMQYTGLKDKNGVEIYESDLLKLHDGTRNPYTVLFDQNLLAWAVRGSIGGGNSLMSMYEEDWTVIGNIWEHKELQ